MVHCVRTGKAQKVGNPPLSIAAITTGRHPKTGEAKLIAWTPAIRAQFVLCVRTSGETTDPAEVGHRVFKTMAPLKQQKEG